MTEHHLSTVKDGLSAMSQAGDIEAARSLSDVARSIPRAGPPTARSPGAPLTVTEAFINLHNQQNQIKAALDRLIDDATTLRAQL